MIFVTVGTHEQPFNRLIEAIDNLKGNNLIDDEVIIQKGYSTYEPRHCISYDLLSYEDMDKYRKEARIVITHGGPASFIEVLSLGKMPIVVPRQAKYGEHVNDHQLEFCRELVKRKFPILVVEDILNLYKCMSLVEKKDDVVNIKSNTNRFNQSLKIELIKLMGV